MKNLTNLKPIADSEEPAFISNSRLISENINKAVSLMIDLLNSYPAKTSPQLRLSEGLLNQAYVIHNLCCGLANEIEVYHQQLLFNCEDEDLSKNSVIF